MQGENRWTRGRGGKANTSTERLSEKQVGQKERYPDIEVETPITLIPGRAKAMTRNPVFCTAFFTGMKGIKGIRENATTIIPA